ncbi:Uncharacterised protein [Mycobacteroides abscessus subsp. massiliense]|nr:Uncharacterised protein [Mycobacteroides abscessus subsp. massiliense]
MHQCIRELMDGNRVATGLLDGAGIHLLKPIGVERACERPPSSTAHIGHHGDAIGARTLRIQLAKSGARLVQRQRLADGHPGDQRIVGDETPGRRGSVDGQRHGWQPPFT